MENSTTTLMKVIVFQIGNEEYAVSVDQVGSIERVQSITRVPQTTNFVKGIINLRGVIIPVIDLRIRFGMEEIDHTESTRIIIIHLNDIEVGLIVDVANDVLDLPEDTIESAPEVIGTVNVDYISGVAKHEKRLLILLDLQKVLATEEVDEIQGLEG
jgi:purine-binding chemotaxis protein CheW